MDGMGEVVNPPATLHFDGACRGNPATAGIGFVLRDGNGQVIEIFSRLLGPNLNCNVTEYNALIAGLRHALAYGITDIVAYGSSQLVCYNVNGKYKVRDEKLKTCYTAIIDLQRQFQTCRVEHVPREHNNDAVGLANSGIDEDPVDRRTHEILQRCTTLEDAMEYLSEKRCEGISQLCFILDTIQQNLPLPYDAVQQWYRAREVNDDHRARASFLVQSFFLQCF